MIYQHIIILVIFILDLWVLQVPCCTVSWVLTTISFCREKNIAAHTYTARVSVCVHDCTRLCMCTHALIHVHIHAHICVHKYKHTHTNIDTLAADVTASRNVYGGSIATVGTILAHVLY